MYQVVLPKKVQKDLERINKKTISRIYRALGELELNPFRGKKLKGRLDGIWSYRVWPYRIIYEIRKKELLVLVIRIGYRRDVYE